jgi:hypothetical protein
MVSVKVMAIVPALFITAGRFLSRVMRSDPNSWQHPTRYVDDGAVYANFPRTPTASAWLTYYTLMAFWHGEAGPADQLLLLLSMLGTSWFGFIRFNTKASPLVLACHVASRLCAFIVVAVAFVHLDGRLFQEVLDVAPIRDKPFRLSFVLILKQPLFWRAGLWSGSVYGGGTGMCGTVVALILIWVLPVHWNPKVPQTKLTDVYLLIPLARWNTVTKWIAVVATAEIVCAIPVAIRYENFVEYVDGHVVDDEPKISIGQIFRYLGWLARRSFRRYLISRRRGST